MIFLRKKYVWAGVFVLAGVNILFLSFFIQGNNNVPRAGVSPVKETEMNYPELDYLRTSPLKYFEELSEYFSGLAKKKGGEYAFEVLKRAAVGPDIDMHLLAHVVGDILYQQQGLGGIKICTEDFRNACSHSIVVGLFSEKGEAALPKIAQACYQAPGGSGAYTMCFHGLGHGMLAYASYNLEKAVGLCGKTGTAEYEYQESSQCISGTIMEIISGGGHDPLLWAKQRPKYLRKDDPLYPCSSDSIPPHAKYLCYLYLTPHLFEVAGENHWTPTAKAFPLCDKIPRTDPGNRDACYGGFGKEFVGFVAQRDTRASSLKNVTENQLKEMYDLCLAAGNQEGILSCIRGATNSLFWGGENDRSIGLKFCSLMQTQHQQNCFANLMGAVNYYIKDPLYKKEFCQEIPQDYQKECREKLL